MNTAAKWFESWFNTPYYHLLYNKRDFLEAQLFMSKLVRYLKLKKADRILDLACGKGRHSIYLNSLGFDVTGVDLSKNSIKDDKKYINNSLNFKVQDMRDPFDGKYDAIFNLFTSFGYFETDEEDLTVLKNIKNGLAVDGVAVIDYLNITKSINELVQTETQKRDTINFDIKRYIADNFIIKDIAFSIGKKDYLYTERVKCLNLESFKSYFTACNLKLIAVFGDYSLHPFNKETSDRLILVVK